MRLSFIFATFICIIVLAGCTTAAESQKEFSDALMHYSQTDSGSQLKGKELLLRAADHGNADAELTLGYAYAKGERGFEIDATKGFTYFLKAARKGNRDAQYNVGLSFVRGQGIEKNEEDALQWFTKAARQGDAGAEFALGVMHYNGEGTEKSLLEAVSWFTLAAEKRYEGAAEALEEIKPELTQLEVAALQKNLERLRASIRP